jgi:drug/metabolite transporter (DMT)-like permease
MPATQIEARGEDKERGTPSRVLLVLAFLAINLIWGSTYLAIRYAVATIPPLVVAGARHLVAGSVLLGICCKRGFRPKARHWAAGLVLGFFFFLIAHGTLHWAEQYVDSGLAALVIATEPVWILVIGAMLGQERVNWKNGTGLVFGLVGVAVLTGIGFTARGSHAWGMLAILISSISWSVGVCISPRLKLPEDPMGRAAIPLLCGSGLLLISAALSGEISTVHLQNISLRSTLGLAYLVVFGSLVAFTSYIWLLQHCSPTLVATHTYVNPIIAVLLGWWLAGETVTPRLLVAAGMILAAILLIQRGGKPVVLAE